MTIWEILLRLLLATVMAGIIGFDREFKSRPAGLRTHILVCVGAAIVALIQQQIVAEVIELAITQPAIAGAVRSDPSRLIAQVVSGIGFLGAGTIIITKHSVMGLTTAASLWAMAGLGLAIGMGYYKIAIPGFFVIFLVLSFMQKLIHIPVLKSVEIQYTNSPETKTFISDYFNAQKIVIKDINHSIEFVGEAKVFTDIYVLEPPKNIAFSHIVDDLSVNNNISRIRVLSI